jgi:phage-related tail fiber protein
MANTLRIKRRAAGGAAGAPASLQNAELAFNEQDNTLYYGFGTGGSGGSATTVIPIAGSGAFVGMVGAQSIDGVKTFLQGIIGSVSGNAGTATALATARTINGVSFNGTANITLTANTTNALTAGSFLTGGTFNGSGAATFAVDATNLNTASKIVARDASGNFAAGTITASLFGNATTATSLATTRSIAASGDATWTVNFDGSANATAALTLAASGVTAGSYRVVTVDAKGRVTAGTNPTTLAGYGITDAQPLDADLTAIAALAGTSGLLRKTAADTWSLDTASYLTANQNVTVSGDATGSGTTSIALTLASVGTAGTYTKVTTDAKGRVTAGTTLAATDIPTLTAAKISDFDTQVRLSRLDQMALPTADVSLNSRKITNLLDPVNPQDAATKNYVDMTVQGLDPKQSVRAATTANIATLSGTMTIDGIALIAGDRVLVKDQTTQSQNGIYVVAAGAWTRSLDADAWTELPGAYVFAESGTTNADMGFVCTAEPGGTINTTAIVFQAFSGAGQISAGNGLTKTGNSIDIVTASAARIVVNADSIDLATIGTAGTYRSVTVDAYGRVSAGTNPTTLAGYGITDAQGLDAELTALAGLVSAADRLPYFTGSGTAALATYTAFARTLDGAVDAAAARTTLGLGSLALLSSINNGNWSGAALTVSNGGTGATSLTGYVKGNGTGAMTAAATIPNTDISGLGTMSTQAASGVAITGGSITNLTTFDGITIDGGTF